MLVKHSFHSPALKHGNKRLRICSAAPRFPETGPFAPADPNAEIYSPLAGTTQGGRDIFERGGRYTSDFIWNTKWQEQLEYEANVKELIDKGKREKENPSRDDEKKAGTVSFSRKAMLDSMDVDLSAELRKPKKKLFPDSPAAQKPTGQQRQVYIKPSPAETRKWDRRGRFARVAEEKPVTIRIDGETLSRVQAERAQYQALQRELLLWALGFAGAAFGITLAVYGTNTGVSYAVGAVGGITYLRLLNKTVDGISSEGGSGGGLVGQPRLLIPIILALGLNRWNTLAADEYGITLELLPMLVGFFTYKFAVITRSSVSLWGELTANLKPTDGQTDDVIAKAGAEAPTQEVTSAKSVEKEYLDKVLLR